MIPSQRARVLPQRAGYLRRILSQFGSGLAGAWTFQDLPGSTAVQDRSGNGRNLTVSNVTFGIPGLDGLTAADFNGTSASGTFLTNATWIDGNNGSVALWIKLAAGTWTDATTRIIARFSGDGTASNYCELSRQPTNNRLQLALITGGSSLVSPYNSTGPTNWAHIAWTWTPTTLNWYFNGSSVYSSSSRVGTWVSNSSGYIQISPASYWHKGGMEHLYLWSGRALTAAEIAALYQYQ